MNRATRPSGGAHWWNRCAAAAVLAVLAACGGGGGSSGTGVAPSITAQPADIGVTAGQTATFAVMARGSTPLSYQWQRNGSPIPGATAADHTTPATAAADDGAQFTVVVSNNQGSVTSAAARLSVAPALAPVLTTPPVSLSVVQPATATFSVTATGSAPLLYQWVRNGTPIAGATGSSFTTAATSTAADNGALYSVRVFNAAGDALSDEVLLTVTAALAAPAIVAQPASVAVVSGEVASFAVEATGTAPLNYQWFRNGTAITGATGASHTTAATNDADNGAAYSVVVGNATSTSITSTPAVLTVVPTITPAAIAAHPADLSVIAGQTASFSVVATGTAPLSYQWRKNGTAIAGANGAAYTTPATMLADSGTLFSVVVGNAGAALATSTNATLTVTSAIVAPAITTPPADVTVSLGQTASFSVAVTGSAPFSYQWRRNGVAIAGATAASYSTLASVLADDGALFSVMVGNAGSATATSSGARLTVTSEWVGIREDGAIGTVHDGALAVASDRSGNIVIGGRTGGLFEPPGGPRATNPFLAKYSASGVLLWARQVFDHGSLGGDYAIRGVGTDAAGNIYGVGDTVGALPGNVNAGGRDVIVVKYDPAGNVVWLRQFGSTNNDWGNAIAVDANGNSFIVGDTLGQLPDQDANRGYDFYIARFDAQGNRQWIRESGTASTGHTDAANSVAIDAAGNAYMAGVVGNTYGTSPRLNTATDAYVAKYDSSGNQLWFSRIAGEGSEIAYAVAASVDGSAIYLAGQTVSDFDLPGYPRKPIACCTSYDAFVARLDGAGTIVWASNLSSQTLEGPRHFADEARGITTNADGSQVYVTGFTLGTMPGATSKGLQDIFVARYEGNGTRTWVQQFGGALATGSTHPDAGYGITLDPSGNVFVAGEVIGDLGTPNPNRNHIDWFVMKLRPADGTAY